LRPAIATIERQIGELVDSRAQLAEAKDELEARVIERTHELSATNASLLHEIGERMLAEERTQQLSLQLAHASRVMAISQLATGLAHEVNQPLSAIALYAEAAEMALAAEQPRVADSLAIIGRIQKAAYRAGHLVRNMRNFVRPGQGECQDVQLAEVVDEVRELLQSEIERAETTLHIDLASDLPPVWVNRIQIQQVVLNLIQNALQALQAFPPGDRRVRIVARTDHDNIAISVADNGPGFTPQTSESAFEPFYTTKADGLGLGLALCRTIVRQHRGKLTVRNQPSGGAVVNVSLPRALLHEYARDDDTDCVCRG
jgi:two-component system sensor histidine kinase TtrS